MSFWLCEHCPYTPRDLAGHYDPEGVLHVCAKCDRQQEASTRHYPRKAHRRTQCATAIDTPAMAQPSVAPSVTANSASSGTTAAEPRSAQGNARTASRRVLTAAADGCASCTPPAETRSSAHQRAISRSSIF